MQVSARAFTRVFTWQNWASVQPRTSDSVLPSFLPTTSPVKLPASDTASGPPGKRRGEVADTLDQGTRGLEREQGSLSGDVDLAKTMVDA